MKDVLRPYQAGEEMVITKVGEIIGTIVDERSKELFLSNPEIKRGLTLSPIVQRSNVTRYLRAVMYRYRHIDESIFVGFQASYITNDGSLDDWYDSVYDSVEFIGKHGIICKLADAGYRP